MGMALVVAASSFACGEPGGAASQDGSWRTEPPMLHARAAHAVVSTGRALYALAGTGAGHVPVLEVERFDGHAWVEESKLPGEGLNAPAAVVLGGRIYLIGGFSTVTNVPVTDVRVYDPAKHAWTSAAPLPAPRGGHAAAVVHGRIHVIGGGNSVSTLADHDVYDPASDTWSSRAPLPRSEGSPAAVVFDGKLHAIGGRSGPSDFGDVYVYDGATDRWSTDVSIGPRGTAGAVAACDSIYVFGGESQAMGASLADVLRFRRGTAAWVPVAPMPTARNFARAVMLDERVYVVGGSPTPDSNHASEGSAIVESYEPRCGG
jgi:N-acetylneuraminic acid mutarotase